MKSPPPLVLIADDNAGLRNALKTALEAAGYRVRAAANGTQALALQDETPADVLVTDIFMPEADGLETIEAFRKRYPATRIVAMSGGARRTKGEYLSTAALLGVDATLRKPFPIEHLLAALDSLRFA